MSAKSGTQELHSVGGSHIFFTNLTPPIELSLFGIVPASSKRYYRETISIPRTFASCSSLRPHTPLDTGLKFCTPPPAARCGNLMLMKRYGTLKIDCCIPFLPDSNNWKSMCVRSYDDVPLAGCRRWRRQIRIIKDGASVLKADAPVLGNIRYDTYSLTVQTLTRFQEFSSKRSPIPMPSAWMRSAAIP